jgi:hypothetical protein
MTTVRYCTPEWFSESARLYQANTSLQDELNKLSHKVTFKITAAPDWGITRDILFAFFILHGKLTRLGFIREDEAKIESEFILTASPQEWKKILRGEAKFITDFILGKIVLEQGNRVTMLGVAPYSNAIVKALTAVDLQFPDEMPPDELQEYQGYHQQFRAELDV